jgi:hypothetical protein
MGPPAGGSTGGDGSTGGGGGSGGGGGDAHDAAVNIGADGGAGGATGRDPVQDGGAVDRGTPVSCAALAAGGKPDLLKDFLWQYMVGALDSNSNNRPYDSVAIDSGCVLTYHQNDVPLDAGSAYRTTLDRHVTMNATDCTAARSWATNARFISVLDTGDGCPYGPGNPEDLFEITMTDGTPHRRKTYLCPEPTLDGVRACVSDLVARLF